MRVAVRTVCAVLWASLIAHTAVARAEAVKPSPLNPFDYIGGRHHPELHWWRFETPHFVWYYHDGLEGVAREAAAIGEQVYTPVTTSFAHRPRRKTEMVLSRQDDIVNGLTMPWDRVYVWVRQNDYAAFLAGSHGWLRSVVAHEFQHVVAFDAMRSRGGLISYLATGAPAWYMEGVAEYFTEYWDVSRSDWAMRGAVYRDRFDILDPHDEGFAKVKYLAWQKGDSALVALARHRGRFGLYWWSDAFRASVGIREAEWSETWRRAMRTYYWGFAAVRPPADSLGPRLADVPRAVTWAAFAPDSSAVAFSGVREADQRDASLLVRRTDERRPRWREVHAFSQGDYKARGRAVRTFAWSPDARQLVMSRMHRGPHGSLMFDLYVRDAVGRHGRWLTWGARASEPDWSPDGRTLACVAQGDSAADIVLLDMAGGAPRRLTHLGGQDVVSHPSWSPDGQWIACSLLQGHEADTTHTRGADIVVVRVADGAHWKITDDVELDRTPFWSADGQTLYFTSYRGGTANVFRTAIAFDELRRRLDAGTPLSFSDRAVALTDDGEGIVAFGVVPRDGRVLATTLGSERRPHLLLLDPARTVAAFGARGSALYSSAGAWVSRMPAVFPGPGRPDSVLAVTPRPYQAIRGMRSEYITFLPYPWGTAALWSFADPLAVHQLQGVGYLDLTYGVEVGAWMEYTHPFRQGSWSLSADVRNPVSTVRFYDGHLLYDEASGPRFAVELPFGGRGALESQSSLEVSLTAHTRHPGFSGTVDSLALPRPRRGDEGLASLAYTWHFLRPRRDDAIHPRVATGVRVQADVADRGVWGDVSYRRAMAEMYAVRPIGGAASPLTFGLRGKWAAIGGTPFPQDIVGLTNDTPATAPGLAMFGWHGQRLASVDRLRGADHIELGNRLAFASAELRAPLRASLPVSAFGLRAGPVTGALFLDTGRVAAGGTSTGWHATAGWATRWSAYSGNTPLLVFEWGAGRALDGPHKNEVRNYVGLTLGTPF